MARDLERISLVIGQPVFLRFILRFVELWMLARLEEQRAHLDLKVTLLTKQKAAGATKEGAAGNP